MNFEKKLLMPNTENFHVNIFEGENEMAQNNQLIGQFKVSNLPHKMNIYFVI